MMIDERQGEILEALQKHPDISVKELAARLSVSEPTVRRDLAELQRRKLLTRTYGGAILNQGAADREIPFTLREREQSAGKSEIGKRAAALVEDGMVVMLDASTTAFHTVPYLAKKKDIIAVTSGAKTAVALAEANVRTFSTGGQMLVHSFAYVGEQAERFLSCINADILFFSCHGISPDGSLTERSIEEADLRRAMFARCRRRVLLIDSSKWNKTYFYNMGSITEVDDIISDKPLPKEIRALLKENGKDGGTGETLLS